MFSFALTVAVAPHALIRTPSFCCLFRLASSSAFFPLFCFIRRFRFALGCRIPEWLSVAPRALRLPCRRGHKLAAAATPGVVCESVMCGAVTHLSRTHRAQQRTTAVSRAPAVKPLRISLVWRRQKGWEKSPTYIVFFLLDHIRGYHLVTHTLLSLSVG